ncbi:CubicO group peptidase (beta-lactamase class C family) [Pedobacter sp. AK013]|uniref:serine hydrolase domain-containing protein n=1 Tax=Pedobacter sp. AK013 TaxID=2723071 RepID=UPI00161144C1|nr:serine hydrolase domain-containing protein [Pedobacter sp. AK013]MBB6236408.1 CubicO group peptidase (beta-lactamase class C family) [Pedobacter sp. AK013]
MKSITLLIYFLFTGVCCFAQSSDNPMRTPIDSAVARLMATYMKDGKRVGISIGVNYNGKSYTYNYGETAPGSKKLPGSSSIYEIGSITKTFTGLLIAHAITEGKIALNDDVRKFLPGNFPNLQYKNGSPVKIGYLLAHTAQFPSSFGNITGKPIETPTFLDSIRQIKLDSLKSFHYVYSNVGYQLLGLILENVYHKTYYQLVSQYITSPLGMNRTALNYSVKYANGQLSGYGANKEAVGNMPSTLPGAGSLHASVSDMLKYLKYQNAENNTALKLSHQIIVGDIDNGAHAFQWEIGKTWNWDQYLRVDGGTNGFRSFCFIYPLSQIEIVILSNQKDDSAGSGLYSVASGIYKVVKEIK